MSLATAIITTVHIDWTAAPTIRMKANVDMPEYGLKAEQVFYLVRASANDGTYYIVTWSYELIAWLCPCRHSVERPYAKACRHKNQVSAFCKARANARKAVAAKQADIRRKQEGLVQAPNGAWLTPEQLANIPGAPRSTYEAARNIEQRLARAGLMA